MNNRMVLGVDIGGSHITASLVNLETGCVIKNTQVREQINAKGTATEIISHWSKIIETAFAKQNIAVNKIGIAMPGPFDYDEGIAWMKNQDKFDSLYSLSVRDLLAGDLNIPSGNIRFLNDAESFLKGEVFSGAAKGTSRAIGLTLGTGLGSARYTNGAVEDADLWRSPFMEGIAEDYLSTRWFVKRYHELSGKKVAGVKELASLTADKNALQTFSEFGCNLALFLKDVIIKNQPEIIVLGGNISNAFEHFSDCLKSLVKMPGKPSIQRAKLGEEASLIGAASCWAKAEEKAYKTLRA